MHIAMVWDEFVSYGCLCTKSMANCHTKLTELCRTFDAELSIDWIQNEILLLCGKEHLKFTLYCNHVLFFHTLSGSVHGNSIQSDLLKWPEKVG